MFLLRWLVRAFLFKRLLGGSRGRRTRGGRRVSVGGCCLPLPLATVLGSALALRRALRR